MLYRIRNNEIVDWVKVLQQFYSAIKAEKGRKKCCQPNTTNTVGPTCQIKAAFSNTVGIYINIFIQTDLNLIKTLLNITCCPCGFQCSVVPRCWYCGWFPVGWLIVNVVGPWKCSFMMITWNNAIFRQRFSFGGP